MTFWNMDLNLQRTIFLSEGHYNCPKGNKTVWVTDCVVLANVKKIAVSTTERDIAFYDCAANNFEKHYVICGFQHSVLCMDYWYSPENYNDSALYFGDMNGQVYVLIFSSATTGKLAINVRLFILPLIIVKVDNDKLCFRRLSFRLKFRLCRH